MGKQTTVRVAGLMFGLWFGAYGIKAKAAILVHPYHGSYAEVGWNDEGDTLQVALKVFPEDLEAALSSRLKKTMVLDDRPETDRALLEYLYQYFVITDEKNNRLPMNFLGKEVKHDGAWLYFEFPLGRAGSLHINNRVLFDWEESQINRIRFTERDGARKALVFRQGSPAQRLWSGTGKSKPR